MSKVKQCQYTSLPLTILLCLTITLIACGGSGSNSDAGDDTGGINVIVLSDDASLSALSVTNVTLDPIFQSALTQYDATVGFMTTTLILRPTAADSNASIHINDISLDSGSTSSEIGLLEGENTIEVVVTAEDGVTDQTYFLTVTRLTADTFVKEEYLKASNIDEEDQFGNSIAISGDTIVVGTRLEDGSASGGEEDNTADAAGAAYVFIRDGETWQQQAYLKASNAEADDWFGTSVAISGDTLVVGALREDGSSFGEGDNNFAANAGAAYVFVRNGTTWSQQAYLKASNAEEDDGFGWMVAISNDTLVVSARSEDSSVLGGEGDNSVEDSGAVYVFVRDGETWSQQAYLKASNAGLDDWFGYGLAINEDTVVIGAFNEDSSFSGGEDDNSAVEAGAAYVFSRDGTSWTQQAYLKGSNTGEGDLFGVSVAIHNDVLVVGAGRESSSRLGGESDNSSDRAGAAYVFVRENMSWSQQALLKASNTEAGDQFGWRVATDGDTVIVGAWREASGSSAEDDNSASGAGAAYVFDQDSDGWRQRAYLKADSPDMDDQFGNSVAISGDSLVVGAWMEDSAGAETDNSAPNAGAVYVVRVPEVVVESNAPIIQTPPPVIHLADNLDEQDELGWCIDTQGNGFNEVLHTHSCKPNGGDVQFYYNEETSQICSAEYIDFCIEMTGGPLEGMALSLVDSDSGSSDQKFIYDDESGEFRPDGDSSLCLAAGVTSGIAGIYMFRTLTLELVAEVDASLKKWVIVR